MNTRQKEYFITSLIKGDLDFWKSKVGLQRAIKRKNWLLLSQTMPDLVIKNEYVTHIPLITALQTLFFLKKKVDLIRHLCSYWR